MPSNLPPFSNPASEPHDSAGKVYQYRIQNSPAMTEALRHNEGLLIEQGAKNDLDPDLISAVVRHNTRGSDIRPAYPSGDDPVAGAIRNTSVWLGEAKAKLQKAGQATPTSDQILQQYAIDRTKNNGEERARLQWTYSWVKSDASISKSSKLSQELQKHDEGVDGTLDKPISLSRTAEEEKAVGDSTRINLDAGGFNRNINGVDQVPISDKTIDLLYEFEPRGGIGKHFNPAPEVPPEDSGVTIGLGYDLGQTEKARFLSDWSGRIPDKDLKLLSTVIGLTGSAARAALPKLKRVKIPWETAKAVFHERTIPFFTKQTLQTYPGSSALPPDSFGALVSMTFNRGTALKRDRDLEKREIRDAIQEGKSHLVPELILKSKRLWPKDDGLLRRRDAEAALFLRGLQNRSMEKKTN